ncbi:DUF4214 domain-containing protein [Paenibacillus sp. UMB4589-SE434]|uniref:DUF4214 domain-containing protein n=1 Tax=Paenibacillus sp. UMB4589-SE434 TaxID=3046314 RepID=UPI002551BE52|nr:DUF4214 domain-containing protein [Paenibacillus sp. UMB4589-SE434]MDK8181199.1 DUF4214 domain-containing protein [Paenibacillus sp. UMB4589-SE434]
MLKLVQMLHQLFQLEREEFVAELYRQVLGREAEIAARLQYAAMLSAGTSKMAIVVSLFRSREARQLYTKQPVHSLNRERTSIYHSIWALLDLDDSSFIRQMYSELLDREAEEDEILHYVQQLHKHAYKYLVLVNVMSSAESRHILEERDRYLREKLIFGKYEIEDLNLGDKPRHPASPSLNRKISIVILTWNGLAYTQRCLDSLAYLADHALVDVVVFDNGSTDGTIAYLKQIPWIHWYANSTNVGFPAGNNMAVSMCDPASDIVLLNNDIVIQQQDWLEKLQETAYTDDAIGIVGCRLCGEAGDLQHAGTFIYAETCWGQQIAGLEKDIGQYERVRDVQGIVFASAYLKRDMIRKIGLLDTDYFAYFEDTDYCLRAWSYQYRVVYDGRVTLTHSQNTSTKVNKVDFSQLFEGSRMMFREKWSSFLDAQYSHALNWHSIANVASGYANSSRNLMIALDEQHVKMHYRYVYGPGTPNQAMEPVSGSDYRINLFGMRHRDANAPEVVYGQGDVFFKNTGRYKIGYTMLEVDGLPQDWVEQCNRMNEVWVPSTFNLMTFRESGVHVPIHVMPLGVNPDYFNPHIHASRFSDRYTFLSVFEWGERKAPLELLQAYVNEFRYDEVLLVCKVINSDTAINVHAELRKLDLSHCVCKIMFIYNQELPDYQLGSLYRSADCFVLPTRGEGWGMPILEAMACGIPTIATNWSAQSDFLNEDTGYPIRVKRLVPAVAKCPYYLNFRWAEPDFEHMASLMRYVYTNRQSVRQRSEESAAHILSTYSWEQSARKMISRLNQI